MSFAKISKDKSLSLKKALPTKNIIITRRFSDIKYQKF